MAMLCACGNIVFCKSMCRNCYMRNYRSSDVQKANVKEMWTRWFLNNEEHYMTKKKELRNTEQYKEHTAEYRYRRYHSDINFKLSCILRSSLVRRLKGNIKNDSAIKNLGCSLEYLKKHLESKFLPGMSWGNWTKDGWHIDHIVPLSKFDLSDREQFLKVCHYTNLQPLWAEDNLSKGNK